MPILAVMVSAAMFDAVKAHAKIQTKVRGRRVTMTDVVIASLRLSGFERDDVLEKLDRGEVVEIDVRRRSPAAVTQTPVQRVVEYLAQKGCSRPLHVKRSLHMPMADVLRGIQAALDAKQAHEKPFDRPRIIHWNTRCDCAVALAANDRPMRKPPGRRRA